MFFSPNFSINRLLVSLNRRLWSAIAYPRLLENSDIRLLEDGGKRVLEHM